MAQLRQQPVVIDLTLSDDDETPAASHVPMTVPSQNSHWQGSYPPTAASNPIRQVIQQSARNIINSNTNYYVPIRPNVAPPGHMMYGNANVPRPVLLHSQPHNSQIGQGYAAPPPPRFHKPGEPKKSRPKPKQQDPIPSLPQYDGADDAQQAQQAPMQIKAKSSTPHSERSNKRDAVDQSPADDGRNKRMKLFNESKIPTGSHTSGIADHVESEITGARMPALAKRSSISKSNSVNENVAAPVAHKSVLKLKTPSMSGLSPKPTLSSGTPTPRVKSSPAIATPKPRSTATPKSSAKSTPTITRKEATPAAAPKPQPPAPAVLSRRKLAKHIESAALRAKADEEGEMPWLHKTDLKYIARNAQYVPNKDLGMFAPSTIIHVPFDTEEVDLIKKEMKAWYKAASPEDVRLARSKDRSALDIMAAFIHARANTHFHGNCGRTSAAYAKYIRSIRSHTKFLNKPSSPIIGEAKALVLRRGKKAPNQMQPSITTTATIRGLMRSRGSGSFDHYQVQSSIETAVYTTLDDSYIRAAMISNGSGDFVAITWMSDTVFVGGALATSDSANQQYNREGNLVIGSFDKRAVQSIAGHRTIKDSYRGGTDEKWLYHSVTACAVLKAKTATEANPFMEIICFTASFDHNVKIWNAAKDGSGMTELGNWKHGARVHFVVASEHHNKVATAAHVRSDAIRVYDIDLQEVPGEYSAIPCDEYSLRKLSPRTNSEESWAYFPSCMKWGKSKDVVHYLLAGFSPSGIEDDDEIGEVPQHKKETGQLCVWDTFLGTEVNIKGSRSQNVFEVAWHPTQPVFIAATSPKGAHERYVRTQIQVFNLRTSEGQDPAFSFIKSLDCEASDINEITINPYHCMYSYITASCTNRKTYVWDSAKDNENPIHTLEHGESIDELDQGIPEEEADVGVKFVAWGRSFNRLYTGSSDGVLKLWDLTAPPGQQLVKDLLYVPGGISGGAFSDDRSKLVIGDGSGNLHLMESFVEDEEDDVPQMQPRMVRSMIQPHKELSEVEQAVNGVNAHEAAQEWLRRGLKIHPKKYIGVYQGLNYEPIRATPSPVNERDFAHIKDYEEREEAIEQAYQKADLEAIFTKGLAEEAKRRQARPIPTARAMPNLGHVSPLQHERLRQVVQEHFSLGRNDLNGAQKENLAVNCAALGMSTFEVTDMLEGNDTALVKALGETHYVVDGLEEEDEDEVEAIPVYHAEGGLVHERPPHELDSDEIQDFAESFIKMKETEKSLGPGVGLGLGEGLDTLLKKFDPAK